MRRITGRGAWNAANARLANKPFDDLFAPAAVTQTRIGWCNTYQTTMPHTQTPSGEWICACGETAAEDLGTHMIISGSEVFELDAPKPNADE